MYLYKNYKWSALLCGAIFSTGALLAQQDNSQALLDLLVKRGVLKADDAAQFQKEVASRPPAAVPAPAPTLPAANSPANPSYVGVVPATDTAPLGFKIGAATFTPVGFLDFTMVHRSTNVGSGIGTNFAGIPYSNTATANLGETKFSAQNSRLGLRMDSMVDDAKVLGYVETDFLGNAPTNLGVSSNAATMRMRVYFADIALNKWEFLAGQDWSMLTANRKGISPMPSDIFFTNDMDTNYQAGLVWARQPQLRAVYHASSEWTYGVSLENPDQYAGGTNGSPSVTFPSGFNTAQVDTGSGTAAPNSVPDVIAKVAYDTKIGDHALHAEVGGLFRTFKIDPTTTSGSDTAYGYGGTFNTDFEVFKNFHLIENLFISNGGGRYVFGQGPDFVVNRNGADYTLDTVNACSGILGFEWQALPKTQLFGYYSRAQFDKNFSGTAGSYVGYGYPGAPNSQNRSIEEYTLGAIQTIWKNPAHGALQIIGQASYVQRDAFSGTTGPSNANTTMFFLDLRYVLP